MLKIGDFVKVQDIGPLVEVLLIREDELYLQLDSTPFWCNKNLIQITNDEGELVDLIDFESQYDATMSSNDLIS